MTKEYRVGRVFTSSLSTQTHKLQEEKYRSTHLTTHANTFSTWDEDKERFERLPVPGSIEGIMGCCYEVELDNDPKRRFTVAGFHTLSTLKDFPEFPQIQTKVDQLVLQLYGRKGTENEEALAPLFALPHWKENDRSIIDKGTRKLYPYDGSYNLSTTIEKNTGQGLVVPALQIAYPEAAKRIGITVTLVTELHNLIAPMMWSKFENEIQDYILQDNNTFTAGKFRPGPIAMQMNVSSGRNGGSLARWIGIIQGEWHCDCGDACTHGTIFMLFLRLPKGSCCFGISFFSYANDL